MRSAGPLFMEAHSESFRKVLTIANQIARFNTSILITGETGTGKEKLARHIHLRSARAQHAFIGINCGALPETLLESELFGHKAGAFTGALQDRQGLFEAADKGTIFLDEIGDISASMQLKLLRTLQEREIRRLGESKVRHIDVRIIAATNRSLERKIAAGKFREDLFYRLRVVEIRIPPLRERREDIVPLARFLVQRVARKLALAQLHLDARCLDMLLEYSWPGNVRELENAIEHAAVFSRDGTIIPAYLPAHIVHAKTAPAAVETKLLADMEKAHITQVLESVNHNRTRAAQILGISQSTLWRKMKKWGGRPAPQQPDAPPA
ncbi:MAG: sigma 54-interacting transcriptional regulator [Lentisphaerae bacterium]|nr:sigma 54-interacting transcriptional regulator [Lentisphaerota bacterium]